MHHWQWMSKWLATRNLTSQRTVIQPSCLQPNNPNLGNPLCFGCAKNDLSEEHSNQLLPHTVYTVQYMINYFFKWVPIAVSPTGGVNTDITLEAVHYLYGPYLGELNLSSYSYTHLVYELTTILSIFWSLHQSHPVPIPRSFGVISNLTTFY